MRDADAPRERPAITSHNQSNFSIVTDRWRYIQYVDGAEELYDIVKDPYEWENLANNPKYAQVKTELRTRLLYWMRSTGDKGQQTELEAPQHQARNRNKKAREPVKKPREDKRKPQRSS